MLSREQYLKIQELKEIGVSKQRVSIKLNLSYKTICNWWDKDLDFFDNFEKEHEIVLDNYRQYLIEILKVSPQINNTVLLRRLQEDFSDFDVSPSHFFSYIKKLREQAGLEKPERRYQVRLETEPGYESQVDFGQYVMKSPYGKNIRVYFFCMTLSYSRMKFAYFSVNPFTARTTIEAHIAAFRYFGGRTQLIMYDQDKTMVVSENMGDVVFVKEFEDFIKETGFSIYLCKGYDPNTKGKIEKTVDYVKHQFLDGRIYYGLDRLNCELIEWLDNDGNGMINDTTKKVPREMFRKEYPRLQKYYEKKTDEIVVRSVYHDTVEYKDNLYKLPQALVDEGDRIRIEKYDDDLLFYHALTSELLCKHKIVGGMGNIVTLKDEKIVNDTVEEVLLKDFKDSDLAIKFVKRMREQKPRYVYPQCRKLQSIRKYYADFKLVEAMNYCVGKDICTMFELCSYLIYDMGEEVAKKYLPVHTLKKYKERSTEIRKELLNG